MISATKIRLYPNKEQRDSLSVQFGHARFVYNEALQESQKAYRETGKGLNYYAMAVKLPKLKKEHPWLKDAYAQVLQQSLQNLARAYENFFAKRAKYPNFKKKSNTQSISYPQNVKFKDGKILLPKVGLVKCVIHREIVGNIKTVTVTMNAAGQYHASVLTDNGLPEPKVSTDGKAIGIDVGLTDLAVTSNGSKYSNPRHLNKAMKNLKRKQKKLSRKKKGSNSRNKARQKLAKAHLKVANARKDYLHKLSRKIVDDNQVVCVETLNVKGMTKNHKLAKSISDAGWGTLVNFLEYKCAREGKAFVKCDRWFPSSKACSSCGAVQEKMPLDIRSWECHSCGTKHDRDVNAAKNIRDEGLRILAVGTTATASGGSVRRSKKATSANAVPCEARSLRL